MKKISLIVLLYILFSVYGRAQGTDVSGYVYESGTQEPLPGVSIIIEGTSSGTTTNSEGWYKISAKKGDRLKFSYVGMKDIMVTITNARHDIIMETGDYELDEVVVVAFGTQLRSDLASSVASFKNEKLAEKPVFTMEQAIQGKMPGVKMSVASGIPGGTVIARVRGSSSFSAGNNPLYVIDGIPMNDNTLNINNYGHENLSAIADINPSDIASVEVLKDASASALYGSRASNGVILITTKKGEYNKSNIRFDAYYGVQDFVKKVKFADARTWLTIQNEARDNYNRDNNLSEGAKLYQKHIGDPNNPRANVDWVDEITRSNGAIQNYQISFSGGNNKSRSYVAGGFFNQKGLIIKNDYDKYNFRVNLDHQVLPSLKIGTDLTATYMQTTRLNGSNNIYSPWRNAISQRPDEPIYNDDGSYYATNSYNPIQILNESEYNTKKFRFIGGIHGELTIYKGLIFKSRLGTDLSYLWEHTYDNSKSLSGKSTKGAALDGRSWMSQLLSENMLAYNHKINDVKMDFLLGQSYQTNTTDYNYLRGNNFPSDELKFLSSASLISGGSSSWSRNALLSYFGRARFNLAERYIAEMSVRRDGSSKFSGSNKYGTFPSAAIGWIIDNESFFPDGKALTGLKLRMSYGLTGNQGGISDFVSRNQLSPSASYNDVPGFAVTTKANKNLKWEKTEQFDIGLDMGFLNNRITAIFDYYNKRTKDLLMSRSLLSTSGFSTMTDNIGSVRNQGIEFSFTSRNIVNKDFVWTTHFNITHEWNKVLALNKSLSGEWINQTTGWYQINSVGKPIGAYYLIKALGVYQNQTEIPEALWKKGIRPGDMKYEDSNNDGVINSNDRQILSSAEPKVYGGFDNTFTFKSFDFSISTYYSLGGKLFSMWAAEEGGANLGYSLGAIIQDVADKRWQGEGTSKSVPRAVYGTQGQWNTQISDRFFEDASYLKIKEVILGYSLPKSVSKKMYMENLRLYLMAQNLLTFTKYSGYDPEVMSVAASINGTDQGTQPQPRSLIVGVNITF